MVNKSMNSACPVSVDWVLRPIEQARGLPNETYVNRDYFAHELNQVLGKNWAGIGFASDLPTPGYVKPLQFLGLPLLLTRSKDDRIHVFHNVCSHRGHLLVDQEGASPALIRCPYHSWSYDLGGRLKATPHIGGVDQHALAGFDRGQHGLKPVRHVVWMDVIFINLSDEAPAFSDYIAPLRHRWDRFIGQNGLAELYRAKHESELTVEVASNWKLAVENYCESYHLPFLHPGLNQYSRLEDHYHIMIEDRFAGQGSLAYTLSRETGTTLPTFPEWPRNRLKEAEYVSFYPNVLLGIQADHAFVMVLEPVSENRTIEHLRVYYVGKASLEERYALCRQSVLASWKTVFQEDVSAVEGMQRGRQSPGYQGGVFSPVMDTPTHHFHQWVATQLIR